MWTCCTRPIIGRVAAGPVAQLRVDAGRIAAHVHGLTGGVQAHAPLPRMRVWRSPEITCAPGQDDSICATLLASAGTTPMSARRRAQRSRVRLPLRAAIGQRLVQMFRWLDRCQAPVAGALVSRWGGRLTSSAVAKHRDIAFGRHHRRALTRLRPTRAEAGEEGHTQQRLLVQTAFQISDVVMRPVRGTKPTSTTARGSTSDPKPFRGSKCGRMDLCGRYVAGNHS